MATVKHNKCHNSDNKLVLLFLNRKKVKWNSEKRKIITELKPSTEQKLIVRFWFYSVNFYFSPF